jgi:hypothetical protein
MRISRVSRWSVAHCPCGSWNTPRPVSSHFLCVEINCLHFCYCHERRKRFHFRFRRPFFLIILFVCDLNMTCRFPFRLNRFLQIGCRIIVSRHPACDIAVSKPLLDLSPYIFIGVEMGLVQGKRITVWLPALKTSSRTLSSECWRVLSPLLDEMRCTFLILQIVLHYPRVLP